jgi:hypothetical protein
MVEAYIAVVAGGLLWGGAMYAITREAFHCFRLASERRALERRLDEQWDDGDEPEWIREARAEIEQLPESVS